MHTRGQFAFCSKKSLQTRVWQCRRKGRKSVNGSDQRVDEVALGLVSYLFIPAFAWMSCRFSAVGYNLYFLLAHPVWYFFFSLCGSHHQTRPSTSSLVSLSGACQCWLMRVMLASVGQVVRVIGCGSKKVKKYRSL